MNKIPVLAFCEMPQLEVVKKAKKKAPIAEPACTVIELSIARKRIPEEFGAAVRAATNLPLASQPMREFAS